MHNVRKRPREQITGDGMDQAASQLSFPRLSSINANPNPNLNSVKLAPKTAALAHRELEGGRGSQLANLSKNDLSEIQLIQQFIMENDLFDDNGDDEEDGLNAHPQEDGISATRSSTPILEIAGKKSAASSLALQGNGGNGLHEYMDVDTTNTNNMNYNDLNSFDDLYDDPGIDDDALIALEMEASSQYFPGPDGSAALPSSAGNARAAAAVQYQIPSVATKDTSPRPHLQQVHDENSHAAMNMNLSVGLTASQKDHLSNQENIYQVKLQLSSLQASKSKLEQALVQKKGECKFAREKMQKLERENAGLHNRLAHQNALFTQQNAGEKDALREKLAESQDAWRNAMDELRSVKTKLIIEQKKLATSSSSVLRPVIFPKPPGFSNTSFSKTRPSTTYTPTSKAKTTAYHTTSTISQSSIGVNTDPLSQPLLESHRSPSLFTKPSTIPSINNTLLSFLTNPSSSPLSLLPPSIQSTLYSLHSSTILSPETQGCGSLLFPALWRYLPLEFHSGSSSSSSSGSSDGLSNGHSIPINTTLIHPLQQEQKGRILHDSLLNKMYVVRYVMRTLRQCLWVHQSRLCGFLFEVEDNGGGLEYIKSLSLLFSFVGDWMVGVGKGDGIHSNASSAKEGEVDKSAVLQQLVVQISNDLFKILWSCCFYACDSASSMLSLSFLGSAQMRLLLDCGVEGLDYVTLVQIASLVLKDDFLGPRLVQGHNSASLDNQAVMTRSHSSSESHSGDVADQTTLAAAPLLSLATDAVQSPTASLFSIFTNLVCTTLSSTSRLASSERICSFAHPPPPALEVEVIASLQICVVIGDTMHANLSRYPTFFSDVEILHNLISSLYHLVALLKMDFSRLFSEEWEVLPRSVVGVLEMLMWVMTRGATREISLDLSCMSQLLTSLTRLAQPVDVDVEVDGVVDGCKDVVDPLTGHGRSDDVRNAYMQQIRKLAVNMLSLFDN